MSELQFISGYEHKIERLEQENQRLRERIAELEKVLDVKYVPKLKQQLAEKDAENQQLRDDLDLSHDNWDKLEQENQRLMGLLKELWEFRKRDDRGDPDYMPSDWWYDDVWSRVEKELSDE